jgi:putative SOS response-associated peptidase YedK
MCGRYRLSRRKEILAEYFDAGDDVDWAPRYNVAPGHDVPVVRQDAAKPVRSLSLFRWGLVPWWAKDPKAGYKMINARAESVADKPAFRDPLQSRRCLIPADAFYEWTTGARRNYPTALRTPMMPYLRLRGCGTAGKVQTVNRFSRARL